MTRYAIVPVEATDEMLKGAYGNNHRDDALVVELNNAINSRQYTAMLAAAPSPLEDAELVERVATDLNERLEKIGVGRLTKVASKRLARAAIAAIGGK